MQKTFSKVLPKFLKKNLKNFQKVFTNPIKYDILNISNEKKAKTSKKILKNFQKSIYKPLETRYNIINE